MKKATHNVYAKKSLFGILCFSFSFLLGCSFYKISSEETTFDYYPAQNSIQYLADVNQPHKTIGYVTINAERNQKKEEILDRLKTEAASIGGDAITNITISSETKKWTDNKLTKIFANANIREDYTAEVIVFLSNESNDQNNWTE